jgi:hypothetical protein
MDERQKKAFDFAADLAKQLITLSTGLIALTITFWKDIVGGQHVTTPSWAYWSWYALVLSALCGVWVLMALTGELQPTTSSSGKPSIRGTKSCFRLSSRSSHS